MPRATLWLFRAGAAAVICGPHHSATRNGALPPTIFSTPRLEAVAGQAWAYDEDGRAAASLDHFDCIWARILDVPAALGARRAERPAQVVAEVTDPLGYAAGRWRIELSPDGAEVAATSEPADVALPAAALGAMFLGGRSARRLHDAGWIDEEAPGGVTKLDAALTTAAAPWSPTTY